MMTREQFEQWSRMFLGSTVRDLRHMRDVPRAAISVLPQPPPARVLPPPKKKKKPRPAVRRTYRRAS
jgi:hypothetical protein